jgi:glycosyltransferase involved in cell wall biosynthesis
MEENDSLNFFLNKSKQVIENEDINLLFLNTIYSDFSTYSSFIKDTKAKTIVTLHNVNNWIKPSASGLKGFFETRAKRKIIKNCTAVNILGEAIKKYFLSVCEYRKPVLTLPYAIYEHSKLPEITDEKINFVVPGTIDLRRRDYHSVLDSFETASADAKNIMLTLAGKAVWDYGMEILKKCKKLKEKGLQIRWYDDFIPQPEYEKILHGCDVIISPVNMEMPFGTENEIYGLSKATGATFDMARYAKPGIMPDIFNVPDELTGSVLKYSDVDELTQIIKKISDDADYLTGLKQIARKNSNHFTIDAVRERTEPLIDELFKTERW